MLTAKSIPPEALRTPDHLEDWLARQNLSPESVDCIPSSWLDGLIQSHFSFVAISTEHWGQLVQFTGTRGFKPFSTGRKRPRGTVLIICNA